LFSYFQDTEVLRLSFRKILVANRGEIAVRVLRTCHEMGISTVAVFSEADEKALHVQFADAAECIGPAPSTKSYLDAERILKAALSFGAEAVHPGYGFLSEQAGFAEACRDAGLVFIGPPPEAMRLMGDKLSARSMAAKAGVTVVPGSNGPVSASEEATRVAGGIGYPVMLKASAGGGGKGMRLVRSADEMADSFRLAASEAASAFGDPTLYIEKYIENPRHVEIQILADGMGNAVYLGERECSVQRRHQKLVEETPSPAVTPELRSALGEAAVRVALACGYVNAGTVEFMVDAKGGFYFLEVNARLQVEHPITEMVCGLDLVREQISIAGGGELPFRQDDVRPKGAAIECRIYAEDADRGFMPCPGKITHILWPGGPGVRVDSGIYAGYEVPMHYDPLLAKVCAWAPDRKRTIARMLRALRELRIGGVVTTATFLDRVLNHPRFLSGRYDTHFLEDCSGELAQQRGYEAAVVAAMAAEAVNSVVNAPGAIKGGRNTGGWRTSGRLAGLFRRR
jgi:acetyl-CoA carboxylase biotin carboxylase subunit